MRTPRRSPADPKDRWCFVVATLTCPCHVPVAFALLGGLGLGGGAFAALQGWLTIAFAATFTAALVLLFAWRRSQSGRACPIPQPDPLTQQRNTP